MSKSRRFAFALVGMLQMLRAEARKGWGRASIVALVFPLAMLYVVGTLVVSAVRQALPSSLASPSREAGCGVDPRLRHRYRGSQGLIDRLERRIVGAVLRRVGALPRVLDVPAGYGRFVSRLRAVAVRPLVVADVSVERLLTLPTAAAPLLRVCVDIERGLPFRSRAFDALVNFRYLHHIGDSKRRSMILAELMRVSRRYVVVSYYQGSNLHALFRTLHTATRGDRRPGPAMMDWRELEASCHLVGWRVVLDRRVLPWVHAQRVALLERVG